MEVIGPAGVTLKPSDSVLDNFRLKCESLETNGVCTLLYRSVSEISNPWKSRLRAAYAIEILVKKIEKFWKFFHCNKDILNNIDVQSVRSENFKAGEEMQQCLTQIRGQLERGFGSQAAKVDDFDPLAYIY